MSRIAPLGAPVDRVLGTRLYALDLAAEPELYLVSDLHLDPAAPAEREAFAAWLARVPSHVPLLILGDLFEYWSGPKQVRDPAWQELLALLRAASDRGLRIWILHGNRDFLLGGSFERATGTRVVPGGLLVARPGGRRLLLLHGDELCLNDVGYQKSKRLLRSRTVRALSHVLPNSLCKRVAGGVRAKSKTAVPSKSMDVMRPARRAFAELVRIDCAALVYGHVHRVARGPWPGDAEGRSYYVLPAFDRVHPGWVHERAGSELQFVVGTEARDWPEDAPLGE